ncbi:hypothetical protein [uncultured Salinicola sp.]|uniref:hypothetical protein n=1 Tax=uncultured Salinicola sp. TaxID=1193542 RepID=UPI0026239023|nr:hypothetical protein [uncultured Salinicola sp.]
MTPNADNNNKAAINLGRQIAIGPQQQHWPRANEDTNNNNRSRADAKSGRDALHQRGNNNKPPRDLETSRNNDNNRERALPVVVGLLF